MAQIFTDQRIKRKHLCQSVSSVGIKTINDFHQGERIEQF